MSIVGKMSVGVFLIENKPPSAIRIDITTNVYGRRRAILTIHIQPDQCALTFRRRKPIRQTSLFS